MPGNNAKDWKREPTATGALFSVVLRYRPPKNSLAAFLWRRRMWIETTFGLSLLEPWEKLLVREYLLLASPNYVSFLPFCSVAICPVFVVYSLFTLVCTGIYKLLPQQVSFFQERSMYYILGNETARPAVHLSPAHALAANSFGEL